MGDPHTLNTVATIERQTSVEILKRLLSEAVGPEELIPYAEAFGNQPRLVPLGDLTDALERIGTDHDDLVLALALACWWAERQSGVWVMPKPVGF
jgi:hypothetical protein